MPDSSPLRLSFRLARDGVDFARRVVEIAGFPDEVLLVATGDGPVRLEVSEARVSIPEADPGPGGRLVFSIRRDDRGRDLVDTLRLEEPSGDVAVLRGLEAPLKRVQAWLEAAEADPLQAGLPRGWFRGRDLQVLGGEANEDLSGRAGDDLIRGGAGFDTLRLSGGADTLCGGADIDRLVIAGAGEGQRTGVIVDYRRNLLTGAPGESEIRGIERIEGGRGGDIVMGGRGDQTFLGRGGEDRLDGRGGDDVLFGGARADDLYGGRGDDQLLAGGGRNALHGGSGDDQLWSGPTGGDRLFGGRGDDAVWGGAGADLARGRAGADLLLLSGGDDAGSGDQGDDFLFGGAGEDALHGNRGRDAIWGGEGDDEIEGGRGADSLDGGAGDDAIAGEAGDDVLAGGDGADTLEGGTGADALYGGADDDRLSGGAGDDTLVGGAGADRLEGGAGDDVLTGGGESRELEAPQIAAPAVPSEVWEHETQGGTGWSGAGLISTVTVSRPGPVVIADADVFVLDGAGVDTVTDFEQGVDRIELAAGVGFADLRLETDGDDLRLLLEASDQAIGVLLGAGALSLGADDFV
ncbi:calcium-binding protein [uncultured Albimonas sp.]|uniref:calcium-binding protein n=1 Tax=uncultured Albimonas sp. TaxID=1331701 RepID=UPI0030EBF275